MTSQWRHCNKTHSWYSELNSLQNVYFGFFIFGKLTEWHCFVTYLSNDPRIFHTPMALQSLFVLKVPLTTSQPSNQPYPFSALTLSVGCRENAYKSWSTTTQRLSQKTCEMNRAWNENLIYLPSTMTRTLIASAALAILWHCMDGFSDVIELFVY